MDCSACRSEWEAKASGGSICMVFMNQRGRYPPMGKSARRIGPSFSLIAVKWGEYPVSPAKNIFPRFVSSTHPVQSVLLPSKTPRLEKCWLGTDTILMPLNIDVSHQ